MEGLQCFLQAQEQQDWLNCCGTAAEQQPWQVDVLRRSCEGLAEQGVWQEERLNVLEMCGACFCCMGQLYAWQLVFGEDLVWEWLGTEQQPSVLAALLSAACGLRPWVMLITHSVFCDCLCTLTFQILT